MEDFTELIQSVKTVDWGQSGAPLLLIDAEIRKIAGHADHLAKLETALLSILQSDAPLAAKRGVCKRLGLIASERSVPVLSRMLSGADTSEMARYALEVIPSLAADAALRDALGAMRGKVRVGIINSIGARGDMTAVPLLARLLDDSDVEAAAAAAWALGHIGGPEAMRILSARRNSAKGRVRLEILDAWLVCAQRLAAQGRKPDAVAMYKELDVEGMPAPIRRAASLGVKATQG